MSRNNYDSEPDDDYDIDSVDKPEHLYQLRHYYNIFGGKKLAKQFDMDVRRIHILHHSKIHGSKSIIEFFQCSDEQFKELMQESKKEQREEELIQESIILRNQQLSHTLMKKRKDFATIGTNKAKRRLNKLSTNDDLAKALRIALEIEDKNILAKDAYGEYRNKIYNVKHKLILDLIEIFNNNPWEYGIEKSDNYSASHVIYFEIPGCEQISWHFNAPKDVDFPKYNKKWDKKINSSLHKIENAVYNILKENDMLG